VEYGNKSQAMSTSDGFGKITVRQAKTQDTIVPQASIKIHTDWFCAYVQGEQ